MATAAPGIGVRLRQAREDKHLSIEETAWRTRVRPELLRALEREQFKALRGAGFVPGLLGSYARTVGLDPAEIVRDYERRYVPAGPTTVEHLERQARAKKPPRPKWLVASVVSAAILITAGILGIVGSQSSPTRTLTAVGPRLDGPAAASRHGAALVTVRVQAVEASHLSVLADGESVFESTLAPGEDRLFSASASIEVIVGDAGAVRLSVNGWDLGAPGARGTVYRASFGPSDNRG